MTIQPPDRVRSLQGWKFGTLIIAIVLLLCWLGADKDNPLKGYSFAGKNSDYYNLLVAGFLDGHLSLKYQPHPDLFSADPVVRARAPNLMDASFYQGRYYLYQGAVPALLVFLPYTLLTGHPLAPNAVVLLFCLGGFFFALATFRQVQRDYVPGRIGRGF